MVCSSMLTDDTNRRVIVTTNPFDKPLLTSSVWIPPRHLLVLEPLDELFDTKNSSGVEDNLAAAVDVLTGEQFGMRGDRAVAVAKAVVAALKGDSTC